MMDRIGIEIGFVFIQIAVDRFCRKKEKSQILDLSMNNLLIHGSFRVFFFCCKLQFVLLKHDSNKSNKIIVLMEVGGLIWYNIYIENRINIFHIVGNTDILCFVYWQKRSITRRLSHCIHYLSEALVFHIKNVWLNNTVNDDIAMIFPSGALAGVLLLHMPGNNRLEFSLLPGISPSLTRQWSWVTLNRLIEIS